ncbi:MAG: lipoprotein signal peptidase [Chitinophagales bacterium]|nr:lipoprotein signal peptidase [Chitinophagales bacterium]
MKQGTLVALITTFIVLIIDQVSKIWVKTTMRIGEEIPILGHWFKLHFVENEGMAMGLSWGGVVGKYALTSFRMIAIVLIAIYIYKLIKKGSPVLYVFVMSLILAGAAGNVIDCLFYGLTFSESNFMEVAHTVPFGNGYEPFMQGYVVDMLSFQLFRIPSWVPGYGGQMFFPFIFNIADAAISVGIVLIVIFQKRFFVEEVKEVS